MQKLSLLCLLSFIVIACSNLSTEQEKVFHQIDSLILQNQGEKALEKIAKYENKWNDSFECLKLLYSKKKKAKIIFLQEKLDSCKKTLEECERYFNNFSKDIRFIEASNYNGERFVLKKRVFLPQKKRINIYPYCDKNGFLTITFSIINKKKEYITTIGLKDANDNIIFQSEQFKEDGIFYHSFSQGKNWVQTFQLKPNTSKLFASQLTTKKHLTLIFLNEQKIILSYSIPQKEIDILRPLLLFAHYKSLKTKIVKKISFINKSLKYYQQKTIE